METEVPVLASSSPLQFSAIPLCPGNQTSLITKQLDVRDNESRYAFTSVERIVNELKANIAPLLSEWIVHSERGFAPKQ